MAFVPNMDTRVVGINWTKKEQVLFLRASWDISSRDPLAPFGIAKIAGLPSVFMSGLGPSGASQGDMFKGPYQKADPDSAAIVANTNEPISDAAMSKFLFWTKAPPVRTTPYSTVNHYSVLTINIAKLRKYVAKEARELNPDAPAPTSATFTITGLAYFNIEPFSVSGWELAAWITKRRTFPINEYTLYPQWDFVPPPPGPQTPPGTKPDDFKFFFNPTSVVPKVRVTLNFDPVKVTVTKLS